MHIAMELLEDRAGSLFFFKRREGPRCGKRNTWSLRWWMTVVQKDTVAITFVGLRDEG